MPDPFNISIYTVGTSQECVFGAANRLQFCRKMAVVHQHSGQSVRKLCMSRLGGRRVSRDLLELAGCSSSVPALCARGTIQPDKIS